MTQPVNKYVYPIFFYFCKSFEKERIGVFIIELSYIQRFLRNIRREDGADFRCMTDMGHVLKLVTTIAMIFGWITKPYLIIRMDNLYRSILQSKINKLNLRNL